MASPLRNHTSDQSLDTSSVIRSTNISGKPFAKATRSNNVEGFIAECNLLFDIEGLHALPEAHEPEFLEVECCLDTGAAVHAADRVDFPGHAVEASPGSQAAQKFQAAGGKVIANEGQLHALMEPPNCNRVQLQVCFQVAKVSRPLISVSKLTEMGELQVLCKKDEALVVTNQGATVARFARSG